MLHRRVCTSLAVGGWTYAEDTALQSWHSLVIIWFHSSALPHVIPLVPQKESLPEGVIT